MDSAGSDSEASVDYGETPRKSPRKSSYQSSASKASSRPRSLVKSLVKRDRTVSTDLIGLLIIFALIIRIMFLYDSPSDDPYDSPGLCDRELMDDGACPL